MLDNKIINFIEPHTFHILFSKKVLISLSDKVTSSKELPLVLRNVTKDLYEWDNCTSKTFPMLYLD